MARCVSPGPSREDSRLANITTVEGRKQVEYVLNAESKLLPALCSAQTELLPIATNRDNDFTGSRYLDLAELLRVTKPILAKHKLVLIQTVDSTQRGAGETDTRITVATRLYHAESGEYVVCGGTLGITALHKANPTQKLFATASYMRRNQILAVLALAGADDDTDGDVGEHPDETPREAAKQEETLVDPERKKRLDVLKQIVTKEVFTERDRLEFRRAVGTAESAAELDRIIEDAKTALRIKQRKKAATEPEGESLL